MKRRWRPANHWSDLPTQDPPTAGQYEGSVFGCILMMAVLLGSGRDLMTRAVAPFVRPSLLLGLALGLALAAQAAPLAPLSDREPSAWSVLEARDPEGAAGASEEERRVLRLLTWEQLQAWLDGLDPTLIELPDGRTLAALVGVGFDLSWWTIDAGGGAMAGGSFTLDGTLGQSDASGMAGAAFTLNGGFWPVDQLAIFSDGFEGGNTSRWSNTVGGTP